jgi:hypothetical protein
MLSPSQQYAVCPMEASVSKIFAVMAGMLFVAYYVFTGLDMLDLVVDCFVNLLVVMIPLGLMYYLGRRAEEELYGKSLTVFTIWWSRVLAVLAILLVCLVVLNIRQNIRLAPIARSFYAKADEGPLATYAISEDGGRNEGPLVGEDYGGALDQLVRKRNRLDAHYGYIFIGGWNTGDHFATLQGFNLFVGSAARRRH